MFTGLIQRIGSLVRQETAGGGRRLLIECGAWTPPLEIGESLAVNGACLTVARAEGGRAACDILPETLERTTFGELPPGARLNLERALRLGDPLGGHWVAGHVDGIGAVESRQATGRDWILRVRAAPDLLRDMVIKGSIAIDGVSLTLVELTATRFAVALVPLTCARTTLGTLRPGARVNLETDLVGKHVRRTLETGAAPAPLTWERLRAAGFGSPEPPPSP